MNLQQLKNQIGRRIRIQAGIVEATGVLEDVDYREKHVRGQGGVIVRSIPLDGQALIDGQWYDIGTSPEVEILD